MLGVADDDSCGEDEPSTNDYLDHRTEEGAGEETIADEGDDDELDADHGTSESERQEVGGEEERKGVENTAKESHYSGDATALEGMAAASERTVIGKAFGKAHADAGANSRCQADEKGGMRCMRSEGSCENRRERGNRAIHQSGEARLDNLEDELLTVAPGSRSGINVLNGTASIH